MDKEALKYAAINTGIALLIIWGICLLIRLCITYIRLLIPVFILWLFTWFYIEYKND
jgi:hypothetical protein